MKRIFYLIGAGMGGSDCLTAEAAAALKDADFVLAPPRLAGLSPKAESCPFTEMAERAVQKNAAVTALLFSGDIGFFSAAQKVGKHLAEAGEVRLICGISSLQYFCAKCGISYEDVYVRSVHGRSGSILGAVSFHRWVFVLTGGAQTAQTVCQTLTQAGLGHLMVYLGENLGSDQEKIEKAEAQVLAQRACDQLAVLLIAHPEAVHSWEPVFDHMILRGKTPMTKQEVRWVAVNQLAVCPQDIVWDVGAGTGAMTVELSRRASDGLVYAVERAPEALDLVRQNRQRLGSFHIKIVEGQAPEVLDKLPAPDCVFIGGSGGHLKEILSIAFGKNPSVRVVIACISLETLHEASTLLRELGFAAVSVTQVAVSRGMERGHHTLLMANNPIFLVSGGQGTCQETVQDS